MYMEAIQWANLYKFTIDKQVKHWYLYFKGKNMYLEQLTF